MWSRIENDDQKNNFANFIKNFDQRKNVKKLSENVFRAFDLDGDHGISFSEVWFQTFVLFFFIIHFSHFSF